MPPTYDKEILKKDVRWGKFRLEDIFIWQEQKEINPLHIKKLLISDKEKYPFYGQAVANNGIISYHELEERVLNNKDGKPTLLIHSNNQNMVYLETPFYLKDGHGATSVLQADFLNRLNALYLMTVIKFVIEQRFSYNAKATKINLKNTIIELPICDENKPDFEYMQVYITVLEAEHIAALKKYLTVTGLIDYELTEKDKSILEYKPKWGEFVLAYEDDKQNGLFNFVKRGKRIKSMDRIEGNLPFITAGVGERGFSSYIGNKGVEIFPANSLTIDMFGTVFYRNHEYGADDHITIIFNENQLYSKEVLLFMSPCIEMAIKGKFSYSKNFYASDVYDIKINLPVKETGEPDFEYMESYTFIQQKLAIKDVIKGLDLSVN